MNTTSSKFALISTAKINNAFPIEIDAAIIEALANSIKAIGFNVIPLVVRDMGTPMKPEYHLVESSYQQVSVLMACKLLRERNPQQWSNCTAVIVNPVGDTGERVERLHQVLTQLTLSRP